ncbi:MAG: flippase-like domain-containing protein [Chlorobi bacterium]|nr:flippase-like domain-containing protein [Chlorobiota bacterium]
MPANKQIKNIIKIILKILFSGTAIYYVANNIDLRQVWIYISTSNPFYLILAAALYVLAVLFGTYRLNTIFKALPLHISNWTNIKLYWMGLFYNFFLPGGVGGDGYKVFLLNKYFKTPVKKLISAVLAERVSGLSIILAYILALVYYINYDIPYKGWFFILIPAVSAGYYLFLWIINKSLTKVFWKVTIWSLIIQGIQMLVVVFILKAMGASVNGQWGNYLFLFFLSTIAGAVPITLGGIGARELTFAVGAEYLGVSQGQAVALSLIFYFISLITSVPGLFYSLQTKRIFKNEFIHDEPSV